ncbi:hypothetical protein K491DRAFT_693891 [Lophiostoma macrostomum CBS 122681]|uniref:FAD-binding domain-containing protein n=1 Tax=Lophiostoma macrostomum CBS 122681 TaxID=1314788 RepID=A0A6A6T2Q6_9PLEO|nr:hypothetical protein K491DRAFT_693891 [Lophiostoma macrostomum CBS 122681]
MSSIQDEPRIAPTTTPAKSINTDLLVVGAGPAGASLACFLARYGLEGIMISAAPGTADTPRAHINNMAAMECLRDIGVYEECLRLGNMGERIKHYRWCETMAGEEYARNYSWGNGDRLGDYEMVSPCTHMDLPQSVLEPILVKYATNHGFNVRFHTELLGFSEDDDGKYTCLVQDRLTDVLYQIKTRFLFGADGGRSVVMRELGLPMTTLPGGGLAFNILFKADLTDYMAHRPGNLHWCMRMERDYPFMSVLRMVKPWHEWMMVFFPKGPDVPVQDLSHEEWREIVEDCVGVSGLDLEILGVSKWLINETSADIVSKGNVFCLGDAIHRHPPTLGLGSNTGIQDSFNLAWKIALVMRGTAGPRILDTYNTERQPVGAALVTASNDCLRDHIRLWQALGCAPYGSSEEERLKGSKELRESSKEGRDRRRLLKKCVDRMQVETHALGTEMGQCYISGAVYGNDEGQPFVLQGREAEWPALHYEPCTYPGRRLPHVWLGSGVPGPLVSTLDVAGKGHFTIFTGIGGEAWVQAAQSLEKELSIALKVVSIGRGLGWEDTYLEWEEKRGVEENGCVLVRPDFFVAWRAQGAEFAEGCTSRLRQVMAQVLGLEE